MSSPTWQTPTQLARSLGIRRSTVWRWAARGLVEVRRHAPRTGVRMKLLTPEELAIRSGKYVQNNWGEVVPLRPPQVASRRRA
jgi:hypothetical protein